MFNFGWEESDGLSGEEQRTHSLPPDSQHCTELPAIYVYIWASSKMSLLRSHAWIHILRYTELRSLIAIWCHKRSYISALSQRFVNTSQLEIPGHSGLFKISALCILLLLLLECIMYKSTLGQSCPMQHCVNYIYITKLHCKNNNQVWWGMGASATKRFFQRLSTALALYIYISLHRQHLEIMQTHAACSLCMLVYSYTTLGEKWNFLVQEM